MLKVSETSGPGENSQSQKGRLAGPTHRPTDGFTGPKTFSSIFLGLFPWCIAIHPCEKRKHYVGGGDPAGHRFANAFPQRLLCAENQSTGQVGDSLAPKVFFSLAMPRAAYERHGDSNGPFFSPPFFSGPRMGNENTRHSAPLLTQTHAYVTTNIPVHVGLLVQISHTYSPSIQKKRKRSKETLV